MCVDSPALTTRLHPLFLKPFKIQPLLGPWDRCSSGWAPPHRTNLRRTPAQNQNLGSTSRFQDPQPNDSVCDIQLQLWKRTSDWSLLSQWGYHSLGQSTMSTGRRPLDKKRLPRHTFCEGGIDPFGNLNRTVKHLHTYSKLGRFLGRILWQTSDVVDKPVSITVQREGYLNRNWCWSVQVTHWCSLHPSQVDNTSHHQYPILFLFWSMEDCTSQACALGSWWTIRLASGRWVDWGNKECLSFPAAAI